VTLAWTDDDEFTLDGVSYRCMTNRTAPNQMVMLKARAAVDAYADMIRHLQPRRIMELGIFAGGSTAFLAQLARPERLVTLDYRSEPCAPLERFLDEQNLRGSVSAHYGVDQADVAQLDELVCLFDGPLDLVIDDASHLEPQTRASFNRLFPHLRPGGLYVIEDWSWPHTGYVHDDPAYNEVTPLSALVCELVVASACRPGAIAELTVRRGSAVIRRGPAELNPGVFDLANMVDEVGRDMVDRLRGARTRPGPNRHAPGAAPSPAPLRGRG
jgi:predicted O-methyltransferase YrrM